MEGIGAVVVEIVKITGLSGLGILAIAAIVLGYLRFRARRAAAAADAQKPAPVPVPAPPKTGRVALDKTTQLELKLQALAGRLDVLKADLEHLKAADGEARRERDRLQDEIDKIEERVNAGLDDVRSKLFRVR